MNTTSLNDKGRPNTGAIMPCTGDFQIDRGAIAVHRCEKGNMFRSTGKLPRQKSPCARTLQIWMMLSSATEAIVHSQSRPKATSVAAPVWASSTSESPILRIVRLCRATQSCLLSKAPSARSKLSEVRLVSDTIRSRFPSHLVRPHHACDVGSSYNTRVEEGPGAARGPPGRSRSARCG